METRKVAGNQKGCRKPERLQEENEKLRRELVTTKERLRNRQNKEIHKGIKVVRPFVYKKKSTGRKIVWIHGPK